MTGTHSSYLETYCEEAKEPINESRAEADASRRSVEVQPMTGRGRSAETVERSAATASLMR
ncbi:DUF3072 domain-containing protein [Caballeronia novacaledonica]|uniref:DUF3072 domain-containing protein n=1 Tax=Caballeronia novacaledonica TaxID=1544861 RepID=UPI001EDE133E|nr:DUF3072 domain-containing protein [Caballeronia novacaledonica]